MKWQILEKNSYTPYSSNPESCVIQSRSGKYYGGVKIENVAFPLTIPAIQAACCICLSEGDIPKNVFLPANTLPQLDFWVKEFELEVLSGSISGLQDVEIEKLFHEIETDFDIKATLKELLDQAVVPSSDFPVSALLFAGSGYFTGVNVEVSDWTKGLCAERIALAKAITAGYRSFNRLDIHTRKGEVSSPCGACRQVILEHLPYNEVMLHHADGTLSEHMTVDLLPFSFKSSTLKK